MKNIQNHTTEEKEKQQETVEIIANTIENLAKSVRNILGGRLNRDAVIVLLANSTHLTQTTIRQVLSAIEGMDEKWLKQ
ncbi:MAG: hypothetical protein KGI71_06030 [Patescibacteria group bacterium]|nr:hypothetical protein [Patescibacteria group bacterium]